MRKIIFFILIFLFVVGCGKGISLQKKEQGMIKLPNAIEIGKKELKNIGYSFWDQELLAKADDNNSDWNNHIESSPSILENEVIKKMDLANKEFWAVYFVPKNYSGKGGDAWVFIDRSTGKVIGYLLGK